MSDCLETYYKCLTLTVDVPTLVRNVRQLFYSLYDEYAKSYGPFLNISFEQSDFSSSQAPTNQICKGYQLLFQKKITRFLLIIINTKLDF